MRRETTSVAVRRKRFEQPSINAPAANPASPMALQALGQMTASLLQRTDTLERKIDALAIRPAQEVTISPAPSVPKAHVALASPADTTPLAKTPTPRINRLRLQDIFD